MTTRLHAQPRALPLHVLSAALLMALSGSADAAQVAGARGRQSAAGQAHGRILSVSEMTRSFQSAFSHRPPAAPQATRAPTTRAIHSLADSGAGSLREALITAVDGDVVDLSALRGRIDLQNALETQAKVTIKGPGHDLLTLDGGHRDRVITSAQSLEVSGVNIINGFNDSLGGCLYVHGDVQLTHATLSGCSAGGATRPFAGGGAVAAYGAAAVLYSTISDNKATAYESVIGGGLVAQQVFLLQSTISGNAATQVEPPPDITTTSLLAAGGGVATIAPGTSQFMLSSITGNTVTATDTTTLPCYYDNTLNCTYYGSASGGGVLLANGNVVTVRSTISGNVAQAAGMAYGGGVYQIDNTVASLFVYGTLANNTASSSDRWAYGGGLMGRGAVTIVASAVLGNTVHSDCQSCWSGGGGLFNSETGALNVYGSTLSGNAVIASGSDGDARGGGIKMAGNAPLRMSSSTVSGNRVVAAAEADDSNGGGIAASVAAIGNSTIAFNTAPGSGGGVVLYGDAASTKTLVSTIVANNAAGNASAADLYFDVSGAPVDGGANLVMASSGATLPGVTLTANPKLLPLAFNGGPTKTHALAADSPAIDTGSNPDALEQDQRGYAREVGAGPDIGAYERDNDRIFTNGFDVQLGGP